MKLESCLKVVILGLALTNLSLTRPVMGLSEESLENPLPAENTGIISQADFLKLQKAVDPMKSVDPSEIQPSPESSLRYYPIWYCVAQSYWSGNWYYWYSENLNYARYRALNACTFYNGNTCFVNCQIKY